MERCVGIHKENVCGVGVSSGNAIECVHGGMHPGGIPMQRGPGLPPHEQPQLRRKDPGMGMTGYLPSQKSRQLVDMEPEPIILAYTDLNLQSCVLKVNIHCDGCKQDVQKLLQRIEGVLVRLRKELSLVKDIPVLIAIDQAAVNEAHCAEENRLEQICLKRHDYFGLS
ncbi:hypothetical protein Syun_022171 [Stephania yunnanensis]|uniref:HMA domain-containing protein n=1 Tax=Stephania yunnanensis TaxID=152371 RepID=A0AAP0NRC6_9MAGN